MAVSFTPELIKNVVDLNIESILTENMADCSKTWADDVTSDLVFEVVRDTKLGNLKDRLYNSAENGSNSLRVLTKTYSEPHYYINLEFIERYVTHEFKRHIKDKSDLDFKIVISRVNHNQEFKLAVFLYAGWGPQVKTWEFEESLRSYHVIPNPIHF
jgi:hypothetical protein